MEYPIFLRLHCSAKMASKDRSVELNPMYGYYFQTKLSKKKLNPRARHIIMYSRLVRGTEFRGKIIKYWQSRYINFHHMSTTSNLIKSNDPLQNSAGQEKNPTQKDTTQNKRYNPIINRKSGARSATITRPARSKVQHLMGHLDHTVSRV